MSDDLLNEAANIITDLALNCDDVDSVRSAVAWLKMHDHPERMRAQQQPHINYAERWRAQQRAYTRRKYASDANYRLALRLRHRLRAALRGERKSPLAEIGCSLEELRSHIEKQFTGGMTWDNYGTYWQSDHIRPLHWFDLTKRVPFAIACHYRNVQPLLVADHRAKSVLDRRLTKTHKNRLAARRSSSQT